MQGYQIEGTFASKLTKMFLLINRLDQSRAKRTPTPAKSAPSLFGDTG